MKRKIIGAILVATIALNSIPTFADTSTFTILQTKEDGVINGEYYVNTELDSITWGRLPNKNSQPVLTIPSGSTVTFDTMSHEGLLEDQGRDALAYFSSKGVSADAILQTGIDITSSELTHDFDADGPHIVTGPVFVEGAEPGDVLKVEVLSLAPRVPYGVISNRHYKGALVNEFPELTPRVEGASALEPDKYGNVSVFAPIKKVGESYVGYLEENGKEITFPIDPFLGIMGVAANTDDAWSSVPPTSLGGNIDINELGVGATVYLPVEVAGALFYTGDPHFAQGDGEVALTAVEGSLRADLRLTVLKKGSSEIPGNSNEFDMVFAETEDYWIPIGLNEDLDEAMKQSVRESIDFLSEQLGVDRKIAYAYLSAATDYEVSQVVDKTKGIHALISKIDFREYTMFKMLAKDTEIPATVQADGLYVLARSVFNAMGATYSFNDTTKVLTVKYNGNEYSFCESSNKYYVNGEVKTLTKSPYISNGSYYIPTTALLDVMEIPLNWSTDGVNIYGNLGY